MPEKKEDKKDTAKVATGAMEEEKKPCLQVIFTIFLGLESTKFIVKFEEFVGSF